MFEYLVVMAILSGRAASGTVDCRLIENNADRLACYDSIAGRSPDRPAVRDTASDQREIPPTAQDFGLTEEQRNAKKESPPLTINMLESRVMAIEHHHWDDRSILTLENGQKWALLEPTPIQRFRVGDVITIRKAALKSYLARGPNSGTGIRVRRVN